jgi:hypothetical protein
MIHFVRGASSICGLPAYAGVLSSDGWTSDRSIVDCWRCIYIGSKGPIPPGPVVPMHDRAATMGGLIEQLRRFVLEYLPTQGIRLGTPHTHRYDCYEEPLDQGSTNLRCGFDDLTLFPFTDADRIIDLICTYAGIDPAAYRYETEMLDAHRTKLDAVRRWALTEGFEAFRKGNDAA